MAINITDNTSHISISMGNGDVKTFPKGATKIDLIGNKVIITDISDQRGEPVTLDSSNVQTPASANNTVLHTTLSGYLDTGSGSGSSLLATAQNQINSFTFLDNIDNNTYSSATFLDQINDKIPSLGQTTKSGSLPTTRASDEDDYPVTGDVANDAVDSGNPVKIGGYAGDYNDSSEVAEGDRVRALYDRTGVQFVIGGHSNVQRKVFLADDANTNVDMLGAVTGTGYVITSYQIVPSSDMTATNIRIGFGASTTPAAPTNGTSVADLLFSNSSVVAGESFREGDGSGIIAMGQAGEELRITNTAPGTGNFTVNITYFTISMPAPP